MNSLGESLRRIAEEMFDKLTDFGFGLHQPSRRDVLHAGNFLDGTHLDFSAVRENRAGARKLHRFVEVFGADQKISADSFFRFGEGTRP